MKHALERLDQLIDVNINPQKNNIPDITNIQIQHWTKNAESEIENIKKYLLRRSVKLTKAKAVELLVQQYQVNITLLFDRVFFLKSLNVSLCYNQLYETILLQLTDLSDEIHSPVRFRTSFQR